MVSLGGIFLRLQGSHKEKDHISIRSGGASCGLFQWGLSLNAGLGSIMMRGMVIDMNDRALQTLAQLRAFLDGGGVNQGQTTVA